MTVSLPTVGGYRVVDFEATVVALIESGVVLAPVTLDTALLPERAGDVFLTFVHRGRLVGLKGELSWNGRSLRFSIQDGVHVRRSRYTRVDAELGVTLEREGEACPGTTVNVAPEGVLVRSDMTVALGEVLELALALPGHAQPLKLRAKVVRHAAGMIALHFLGDRRDARAAVAEYVVAQRAAARVA